jgi:hypothetical protein
MTYRAIRTARELARRNVDIGEGLCVLRVRQAMQITEATGDQDGDNDADAEDAWLRCDSRHFVTGDAFRLVRGTWVFLRSNTPGRHGHAAIATGYGRGADSTVWSPGTPTAPRRWRKTTVGQLEAGWGLHVVGYGFDLNDRPVPDVERG